jgi:deazaflavin-dependent oxidoreductase (nitroreductase family)
MTDAVKPRPSFLDTRLAIPFFRRLAKTHVALFRATNGRLGAHWRGGPAWKKPVPIVLLDHVGRKSGKPYTTPLLYMADKDRVVIAASQTGMPKNPLWYGNLMAQPDTTISVRGARNRPVRARTATPEERAELWPRMVAVYADWENYQRWTERTIPVVILEPR